MFPKAQEISKKIKNKPLSTIFIIFLLLVMSFILLTPGLNTILLGIIFAYLIWPISVRLEPFLKFKSLSVVVVAMLIFILPLILIIWLLINQIFAITLVTVGNIDISYLNDTDNLLTHLNNLVDRLPLYFQPFLETILDDADRLIRQIIGVIAAYIF